MQSLFYVSLSGQMSIDQRLQSIAHNVANMNTAGFRGDGITFDTVMSNTGDQAVAFSSGGTNFISRKDGERTKTDNPLDVAVQGDAWLAMKTPTGIAYTHDGRLKMTPTGDVRTIDDYPVLDAGGGALLLDPAAGPPVISADGMMTQNGAQVGAIGLFSIDPAAKLTRTDNSGVIPSIAATPILDFTNAGLVQGYIENSNVNPILELSKLIQLQHDLDGLSQGTQVADTSLQDAIKTLGSNS
jgi:flagellar basal-body rod protein FlgF